MFRYLSQHTVNAANNTVKLQLILFLVGLPLLALFPASDSAFILYYFVVWFFVFAVVNLIIIVFFALKRPPYFLGYIFVLFVLPVVLGLLGFFLAMVSTGITC